ncbi:MAG: ABC transporter transmembrane domain-containing protein [Alphaproteobacteria bacterium]|nr:ABC transporter transmembrane domain-containing protein [Alphaproteobacteria bacterium]
MTRNPDKGRGRGRKPASAAKRFRSLDQSSLMLVRRLWRDHGRKYRFRLVLAVLCMALVAGATSAIAIVMGDVIDGIFVNRDREMLFAVSVAIFLIFLVKGLATFAQSILMNYVGQRVIADIQVRFFDHLMGADLAYFQANHTGKLISHLTNDVGRLRGTASSVLIGLGKDFLTMVFLIVLMFKSDWALALFASVVFPIALYPIIWIGRRVRRVTSDSQVAWSDLTTLLDETFGGVRHVKAYNMEDYETRRALGTVRKIFRLNIKTGMVRASVHPIMGVLTGAAVLFVILFGGWQVIEGTRTAGELMTFITALLLAYEPLKRLAALNANLQEGLAATQRIYGVLDTKPTIVDAEDAIELHVTKGDILFDDVSFSYKRGQTAVDHVNLTVPAGKTVALVGPSGAGKSTLLNLIPRFFDVDTGAVRVDGTDVRAVTLQSLRGNIALVSQEICLFNDTIAANIAYGSPDAGIADIRRAAETAAAAEFIEALPDGYDTVLGERGLTLSGGQRQRVAIARAMLKNAPILLLDEATSALDSESERQVQAGLERLMKGRTTLVIAHRLSTITGADKICYMEGGRVIEAGSHAELMARGGEYTRLYTLQFESEGQPAAEARAGE